MSKHSHWAKIKHGKGSADVQRGVMFTKLSRAITIAAKSKGPDPSFNFSLRLAIDQAKAANMPKDNIERAITKATGQGGEASLEELLYEGILPGGVGVIIEATSDNKNRTLGAIKKIFVDHDGNLAASGAVKWNFTRFGVITLSGSEAPINDPHPSSPSLRGRSEEGDKIELAAIEAGAEDIKTEDGAMIIYTKPETLEKVKNALEKENITIAHAGFEWVPKERITVDETTHAKPEEIFEALEESEEIDEYYTNLA